jgi:hypothetical protein
MCGRYTFTMTAAELAEHYGVEPPAGHAPRLQRGSVATGGGGRPFTKKQVITAVRRAGQTHGPGTVAKALADLTGAGELVNPRDHRGYRLPEWERPQLRLFGPPDPLAEAGC